MSHHTGTCDLSFFVARRQSLDILDTREQQRMLHEDRRAFMKRSDTVAGSSSVIRAPFGFGTVWKIKPEHPTVSLFDTLYKGSSEKAVVLKSLDSHSAKAGFAALRNKHACFVVRRIVLLAPEQAHGEGLHRAKSVMNVLKQDADRVTFEEASRISRDLDEAHKWVYYHDLSPDELIFKCPRVLMTVAMRVPKENKGRQPNVAAQEASKVLDQYPLIELALTRKGARHMNKPTSTLSPEPESASTAQVAKNRLERCVCNEHTILQYPALTSAIESEQDNNRSSRHGRYSDPDPKPIEEWQMQSICVEIVPPESSWGLHSDEMMQGDERNTGVRDIGTFVKARLFRVSEKKATVQKKSRLAGQNLFDTEMLVATPSRNGAGE